VRLLLLQELLDAQHEAKTKALVNLGSTIFLNPDAEFF
jgi:hypothetical protein